MSDPPGTYHASSGPRSEVDLHLLDLRAQRSLRVVGNVPVGGDGSALARRVAPQHLEVPGHLVVAGAVTGDLPVAAVPLEAVDRVAVEHRLLVRGVRDRDRAVADRRDLLPVAAPLVVHLEAVGVDLAREVPAASAEEQDRQDEDERDQHPQQPDRGPAVGRARSCPSTMDRARPACRMSTATRLPAATGSCRRGAPSDRLAHRPAGGRQILVRPVVPFGRSEVTIARSTGCTVPLGRFDVTRCPTWNDIAGADRGAAGAHRRQASRGVAAGSRPGDVLRLN